MGGQDEVEVSMCRFTCSVWSTLQNMKYEPSEVIWVHAPQENFWKQHTLRLNLVLSEHKIAMLRTGSGSLLWGFCSAHKNSFFPVCECSFYKSWFAFLLNKICFDDQLAYTNNKRLHASLLISQWSQSYFMHQSAQNAHSSSLFPPNLCLGNLKDFGGQNWRGMELQGVVIASF